MTVYPESVNFLTVLVEADPDVINDIDLAGDMGRTKVLVTVMDQNSIAVDGAMVVATILPNEHNITLESAVTDHEGIATFTFAAEDVNEDMEYIMGVVASKIGYKNGTQNIYIYVIDVPTQNIVVDTPFPSFIIIAATAPKT